MIKRTRRNILAVIAPMAMAMMIMASIGIYGTMDTGSTSKIPLVVEHYEVKMNATSTAGGSDSAEFGAASNATDGFNPYWDKPQGPPSPEWAVQAYFWYPDNDPLYRKLSESYVNLTDLMTWPLRIELSADANVTVQWNMTDIGNWPICYEITLETPDGDIDMRAVSNYTYENLSTGNHDFDINASIETEPPEISDVQANPPFRPSAGWVNISTNVTDNIGVDEVFLNITYPGPTMENFSITQNKTGNIYYCNKTYTINGTYNYFIWANDTCGNSNTSGIKSFYIGDTTPPEITDVKAIPSLQEPGKHVNITCNVTDDFKVSAVKVNITDPNDNPIGNFTMENGTYYYNASYYVLGNYSYFIWACDTSGNANMSALHQFNITSFLPVANFTWTPAKPTQEDMVQFTDLSTGTIVNWTWSFGDGYFSYEQNSTHRFTIGNVYTVNLTVKDNNNLSDSIEKNVIVDRNVSFLAGYNYFGYSLWNDTNSSALAGLLNLQTFDTIYKYNTSAGYFTGYTVGIGDPDVFNISTWDALIIKVGGGRSSRLNTTNKVNSSRNVSLTTTDGNPGYNYLCWSSYNSTNATEFATLAGLEQFDTIYKYNTTSSSFIGYTVGIGDPDVFDIEPYDVIIVKVASNKEFVIP